MITVTRKPIKHIGDVGVDSYDCVTSAVENPDIFILKRADIVVDTITLHAPKEYRLNVSTAIETTAFQVGDFIRLYTDGANNEIINNAYEVTNIQPTYIVIRTFIDLITFTALFPTETIYCNYKQEWKIEWLLGEYINNANIIIPSPKLISIEDVNGNIYLDTSILTRSFLKFMRSYMKPNDVFEYLNSHMVYYGLQYQEINRANDKNLKSTVYSRDGVGFLTALAGKRDSSFHDEVMARQVFDFDNLYLRASDISKLSTKKIWMLYGMPLPRTFCFIKQFETYSNFQLTYNLLQSLGTQTSAHATPKKNSYYNVNAFPTDSVPIQPTDVKLNVKCEFDTDVVIDMDFDIDRTLCTSENLCYLRWINTNGGYDYYPFLKKDLQLERSNKDEFQVFSPLLSKKTQSKRLGVQVGEGQTVFASIKKEDWNGISDLTSSPLVNMLDLSVYQSDLSDIYTTAPKWDDVTIQNDIIKKPWRDSMLEVTFDILVASKNPQNY